MHGALISARPRERLLGALIELRDRAAAARLPLDVDGADDARRDLSAMANQLTDYLIPRLRQPGAPMLAVVGGPTGAGKSTLVNSLVGYPISPAGVLRPTTRGPVLACHPNELEWFTSERVLPELARTTGDAGSQAPGMLRIVPVETTPAGLALLDAPDIDSVVVENHRMAAQVHSAADLWIFVTTAARYADAIPWDLLSTARARGVALAVLLNRVRADAADEVTEHLATMLDSYGLGATPLFVAPECPLAPGGLLPPAVVAPIQAWLFELCEDAVHRSEVVRTSLEGTLDNYRERITALAAAADAQVSGLGALRALINGSFKSAIRQFGDAVGDGSLLRGEVLARWNAFAGTGELLRSARATMARIWGRLGAVLRGQRQPGADLRIAIAAGVVALVQSVADEAAERVVAGWRTHPAGPTILKEAGIDAGRASYELTDRAVTEVSAWQERVLKVIKERGAARRLHPRFMTYGTTGVSVLLMISALTQTAGLAGTASPARRGGVVSQRLLAGIVGEAAGRHLAADVRSDLTQRVETLLVSEAAGFSRLVDAVRADPTLGAWLRCQLEAIDAARGVPA